MSKEGIRIRDKIVWVGDPIARDMLDDLLRRSLAMLKSYQDKGLVMRADSDALIKDLEVTLGDE